MGDGPDSNNLLSFDTVAGTWRRVSVQGGDVPKERSYHAMTSDNAAALFVFGGCSGHDRLNDLWRFDTKMRTWTCLHAGDAGSDVPRPRGGSALHVTANGDVFVVMGFNGNQLDDVFVFSNGQWLVVEPASPRPPARSVFASASIGDQFYLFGGERSPSSIGHLGAGTFFDDAWRFDGVARTWTLLLLDNQPSARGWCAMSHAGGRRLLLAGCLTDKNERLADMHLLELLN